MLAYVFWHTPRPGAPPSEYELLLSAFHAALAERPPAGFLGSAAYRVTGAAWTPNQTGAYEDWYLVSDSGALDALNDAAISAHRQAPHDAVARAAAWGAAGLYHRHGGALRLRDVRRAWWFAKPGGESYAAFYRRVSAVAQPQHELWTRRMVLGPTPEFCLRLSDGAGPPDIEAAVPVELYPVWSGPEGA